MTQANIKCHKSMQLVNPTATITVPKASLQLRT